MKKTVGDNLKLYRIRANLSMAAAGKKLNMSAPAILKYERNQIIASLSRLEEFAKIYFVTIEEILDVDNDLNIKFTNFKCKDKIAQINKVRIKDLISDKIKNYFNLLKLSEITLINKFGVHLINTLDEAESLATKLRIYFTIPINDPISNLVYLLENNNMMIITLPKTEFTKDFIGFYEIINNVPVIVVPKADNSYEQRFNIAKYLGELLIINNTKKDLLTTQFALSLLLPQGALIEEFDSKRVKINFREIEIFSNNFRVSYKNIVKRLRELDVITASNAKYLNIHINKNNMKEHEYHEVPYLYDKLKSKLQAKGIIK
ncbi:MAG: XRE family transcriptional regulator [Bacilli bacterium]|nr:XRE family transcriptional regulator [Bacilli bacterium]